MERVQAALAKAISEENYEKAASLRDEINKMLGSQN
ncbi:MAG: UvrB/UvrC motif-containing protein [Bacteroidetes bacterium]|nr:UvrB/UvrC motif-containing protein [Bacteroidota bacterium]